MDKAKTAHNPQSTNPQPRGGKSRRGRPGSGHRQDSGGKAGALDLFGGQAASGPVVKDREEQRTEQRAVEAKQPERHGRRGGRADHASYSVDRPHPRPDEASGGAARRKERFEKTMRRIAAALEGSSRFPEATQKAVCSVHGGRCDSREVRAVAIIPLCGEPYVVAFCRAAGRALRRAMKRNGLGDTARVFQTRKDAREAIGHALERREEQRAQAEAERREQYVRARGEAGQNLSRAIRCAVMGEDGGFLPPAGEQCGCESERFCRHEVRTHVVVQTADGNAVTSLCAFATFAFRSALRSTDRRTKPCETLVEAEAFVKKLAKRPARREKQNGPRQTGATARKREKERRAAEEQGVLTDADKRAKVLADADRHGKKHCGCNGATSMECARALRLSAVIKSCGGLGTVPAVREEKTTKQKGGDEHKRRVRTGHGADLPRNFPVGEAAEAARKAELARMGYSIGPARRGAAVAGLGRQA